MTDHVHERKTIVMFALEDKEPAKYKVTFCPTCGITLGWERNDD